jgi:hypothetical protein
MAETLSLKALAERVLRRDTLRDKGRDGVSQGCRTGAVSSATKTHDRLPEFIALTLSDLVERVREAWPWAAERRPGLFRAIIDADDTLEALERCGRGDSGEYCRGLEGLRRLLEEAVAGYQTAHPTVAGK